ncbi:MAG TPA: hypothetical protein VNH20_06635 [Candidatus Dormibacteraeota bacterium]|nr:hypothetical protein [Candidatus Dormibacteraeota bacterium]
MELHLISRLHEQRAWEVCRARAESGIPIELVLLHDAVLETEAKAAAILGERASANVVVMACAEDALARRVGERWAVIDYRGIIGRCVLAERVTSW